MTLSEFSPFVLKAVSIGPINSGDLSEAVWGTSGRGNPSLTKVLFPHMERTGLMKMEKRGRAMVYTITDAGRVKLEKAHNEGVFA